MKAPTGKLAFAYRTISELEAERDQLRAEFERLSRFEAAYNEWLDKTEWVQTAVSTGALPARYLGMHRADVLRAEVEALRKDAERYRWLRTYAYGHFHGEELEDLFSRNDSLVDEKVDEAINAAMAAKDGQP